MFCRKTQRCRSRWPASFERKLLAVEIFPNHDRPTTEFSCIVSCSLSPRTKQRTPLANRARNFSNNTRVVDNRYSSNRNDRHWATNGRISRRVFRKRDEAQPIGRVGGVGGVGFFKFAPLGDNKRIYRRRLNVLFVDRALGGI